MKSMKLDRRSGMTRRVNRESLKVMAQRNPLGAMIARKNGGFRMEVFTINIPAIKKKEAVGSLYGVLQRMTNL